MRRFLRAANPHSLSLSSRKGYFSRDDSSLDGGFYLGDPPDEEEEELERSPDVPIHEHIKLGARTTPSLAIFAGLRGRGKSAASTYFCWMLQKLAEKKTGKLRPIYTNIHMGFDQTEVSDSIFEEIMDFDPDSPDPYEGGILMIDEIAEIAPSVRANSSLNLGISNSLVMIRKRRMDVIGTGQFPQTIGSSVMRQCDFLIAPRLKRNVVKTINGRRIKGTELSTYWWNWSGSVTDRSWVGQHWPQELETADYSRTDFPIDWVFDYYDTSRLVATPYTTHGKKMLDRSKAKRSGVDQAMSAEFRAVRDEWLNGRDYMTYEEYVEHASYAWEGANEETLEDGLKALGLEKITEKGIEYAALIHKEVAFA